MHAEMQMVNSCSEERLRMNIASPGFLSHVGRHCLKNKSTEDVVQYECPGFNPRIENKVLLVILRKKKKISQGRYVLKNVSL